jgi:4-hydroxy-tetrahydrodipicolinate reductase
MSIGIFIPGMFGRMGKLLAQGAIEDPRHTFLGGTVRPAHPHVGKLSSAFFPEIDTQQDSEIQDDLEKLVQAHQEAQDPRVVIDFTSPKMCTTHLEIALTHSLPLVIGTTGLSEEQNEKVQTASAKIPILLAANTSLGANLLGALTQTATRALPDADVEIAEIHHRAKKDAPSGTALMLGEIAANARDQVFDQVGNTRRSGESPRAKEEIGIFGLRGGTVPGEHTVYFFLDGERIEITHRVQDRKIFAVGALAAARTLARQEPGLYTMMDVLGLCDT